MALLRLFAGLILVAVMTARGVMAATDEDPSYEVVENWQDNVRANFCITAPVDLYGWKLKLKFEEPITQMQISRMRVLDQNEDKTEWTLGDEGHNGIWLEGERRCQDFIASGQGLTSGLEAEVQFVELPEDTECPEQVKGQNFTMEMKNHGRNHLSARFCLRVPRDFEDWKIRMEFGSEGITSMQVANTGAVTEVPGSLKKAWVLTPQSHNKDLSEGDTLCLPFDLTSEGWIRPCIRAFFTEDDEETPIEVTLPETTQPPSTSVPPTTTLPETTQPPSTSVPPTTTLPESTEPPSTSVLETTMSETTEPPSTSVLETTTLSETTESPSTSEPDTSTVPEMTQSSISGVPDTTTLPETTQPSSGVPDTTTESDTTTEAPSTTMEPPTTPESGSNYTELQLWKEGLTGLLCLPHDMPITCGWEAEIVFNPAIDSMQIWRAGQVGMSPYQGSSNVVHLTNMNWNAAVSDNPLCLRFNAFKSYPKGPDSVVGQFTRICNDDQWVDIPGGTGLTP